MNRPAPHSPAPELVAFVKALARADAARDIARLKESREGAAAR